MKRMFIEDPDDRVWDRVVYVNSRGVPFIGDDSVGLSDEDIQRCVEWCDRTNTNWMVSEILHN